MTAPVSVTSVDGHGLVLHGTDEVVLDVCFDGRRVWSFWLLRDTEPTDPKGRGPEHRVAWPAALRPFLEGETRLSVVEHVSGREAYAAEHRFGESGQRIAVVGRTGAPLALDKSNRLTATFSDRTEADVAPLLDAIELVLGLMRDAGVDGFPSYGTLLGAVREGTFLGHDSDADLSYVSHHTQPVDVIRESFRVQRAISDRGFDTHRYSGVAFRVDVKEGDGVVRGLDVFGGFLDGGQLFVMGEIGVDYEREWVFPLGSCVLAGRTLPAPALPEKWLEATYGPSWRVPDPAFKFETPPRVVAQLTGWFRGLSPNRQDWERNFSGLVRRTVPPRNPSRLARALHEDLLREGRTPRVMDVGAGRAQDAWFLARQGRPVTAYDYVPRGVDAVLRRGSKKGLDLDVRTLNLTEWRSVLSEGARVSRIAEDRVVLARHVADATDRFGRDSLFRFGSMTLRGGGRMYVDVWNGSGRGAPEKIHPVSLKELVTLAQRHGAGIVSAEELAPRSTAGGKAYGIGRLVAQWD
jgi:hypothetical protein